MAFSDSDAEAAMPASKGRNKKAAECAYLCADDFIGDIFHAQALSTSFQIGLIDALIHRQSLSRRSLLESVGGDGRCMKLLLGLLEANSVIAISNDNICLTEEFVSALEYRDLMELKCSLANLAAHDFLDHFNDFVFQPGRFSRRAALFRLFSYDRALSRSRENDEATRHWMRITTILTKYESQACLKYYDFGRHQRILDVGGNSGEFVLRICREHPGIEGTVFDLPVVCAIGEEHVGWEPEAGRISFIRGNALKDALPGGFDLVMFKSMLHDWPDKEAAQLLKNAARSLSRDGVLLIFERGPIEMDETEMSYAMLPFLLFAHSFRLPALYEAQLMKLNFQDLKIKEVFLDTRFFILTARKAI